LKLEEGSLQVELERPGWRGGLAFGPTKFMRIHINPVDLIFILNTSIPTRCLLRIEYMFMHVLRCFNLPPLSLFRTSLVPAVH
jgi:hypothetical protein